MGIVQFDGRRPTGGVAQRTAQGAQLESNCLHSCVHAQMHNGWHDGCSASTLLYNGRHCVILAGQVHPDTDALLAAITLADPKVVLLVLAGNEPSNNVMPRLRYGETCTVCTAPLNRRRSITSKCVGVVPCSQGSTSTSCFRPMIYSSCHYFHNREVQRAPPNPDLVSILKKRFVAGAGVPLAQLRFTGFLPHHRLLATFR